LSIGPEGPVSLPRDSSETLALLLSRGLLSAERDDHATGRPLVYQPTPRLLQLLGVETLEEARGEDGGSGGPRIAQLGVGARHTSRQGGIGRRVGELAPPQYAGNLPETA
jgi:hypothetical protein